MSQNNAQEAKNRFWRKKCEKLTGRPGENENLLHFDQLCEWIEKEAACYTVKELHQKMIKIADSPTAYTTRWLRKNLIEK